MRLLATFSAGLILLALGYVAYSALAPSEETTAQRQSVPQLEQQTFSSVEEANAFAGFEIMEPSVDGWERNPTVHVRKDFLDGRPFNPVVVGMTYQREGAAIFVDVQDPSTLGAAMPGEVEPLTIRGSEGLIQRAEDSSSVGIGWEEDDGVSYFVGGVLDGITEEDIIQFAESFQ